MRRLAFLSGAILLVAASAAAQLNSTLAPTETPSLSFSTIAPSTRPLYAMALPADPAPAPAGTPAWPEPNPLPVAAPAEPQGVYGVLQNFDTQLYGGYAFIRFYMLPNATLNLNGFDLSVAYYPRAGWIAADGELVAAYARNNTNFLQAMGGARFRWTKPRSVEVWVHGLVGAAHESPQTPYGGQGAFGWEAGGGIDIAAHHRRIAYRIGGDILSTRFFGTYQYSPKMSVGIVYKF